MLNACELEIDLFCKGLRVPPEVPLTGARGVSRTRAGLGSGLELVLPAESWRGATKTTAIPMKARPRTQTHAGARPLCRITNQTRISAPASVSAASTSQFQVMG